MDGDTTHSEHVDYHIEVAGNFQKACEGLIEWIKRIDLKKEQLISISASETTTIDADAVLVVLFRKQPEPNMTSLSGLSYELQKSTADWADQYRHMQEVINTQMVEVI